MTDLYLKYSNNKSFELSSKEEYDIFLKNDNIDDIYERLGYFLLVRDVYYLKINLLKTPLLLFKNILTKQQAEDYTKFVRDLKLNNLLNA